MNRTATKLLTMSTIQAQSLPWYVCRTKPRQEFVAVRRLQEQDYEVFIPMISEWTKTRAGAWQRHRHAMFPRYCFVRCGRDGQGLGPIRSTPGVTGLICFCSTPASLSDADIDAIRALADDRQELENEELPFHPGNAVEITSGPLKGLSGIVFKAAKERISVLLSFLGREKAVDFFADQLTLP